MTAAYHVAVVGAGPTGLTLATLLARRGLRVALLERHHDLYPLPRAVHLDDEVYRILLEVGVGEAFAAVTRPALGLRILDERHRELATFEREQRTVSGLPQANMFDQPDLERILRDNLEHHPGAELLGGQEVIRLDAEPDGADAGVLVRDPSGATRSLRASYVVGCDGARSIVRDGLGIAHRDLGFEQRWLVVDVRSDADLDAWDGVHQVSDRHRAGTYMRIGPDRYRWEFELHDHETSTDFPDLAALRPLLDPWVAGVAEDRLVLLRCAEYTFRARVAETWRAGRVLLAGDAAHLTPPFIGQGLCAGQRDAVNLAWKLDAAVAGRVDPALLDSYEAERSPHVTAIIRRAVALGRMMSGGGPTTAALRRRVMPAMARAGLVQRAFLDSRTPPLVPGPLIRRTVPRGVRGALLPLVALPGPEGDDVLVDRLLGTAPAVVALPGVDPALVPVDATRGAWLTVAEAGGDGERRLARWLRDAGVDWVRVDPDRAVRAAGQARLGPA